MLRINKVAEYGVLALTFIHNKNQAMSAREIAEGLHIPYEITAKTLQRLKEAGLLVSQMGVNGGYKLLSPLSDISLCRVIEALEGPVCFTDCENNEEDCQLHEHCQIKPGMQKINLKIKEFLGSVPVSEFL